MKNLSSRSVWLTRRDQSNNPSSIINAQRPLSSPFETQDRRSNSTQRASMSSSSYNMILTLNTDVIYMSFLACFLPEGGNIDGSTWNDRQLFMCRLLLMHW